MWKENPFFRDETLGLSGTSLESGWDHMLLQCDELYCDRIGISLFAGTGCGANG
ncbi:MAG: hypothetical protein MR326_00135 [Anaerostipes sp.]|nr:hypothetical protein [Anaerostipes sp.]MCI5622123.1 hypothetical protein [Anaerostipes sp.]